MTTEIKTHEWLHALQYAEKHSPGEPGLTRYEIGKLLVCSEGTTGKMIKEAVQTGRMEYCGKKPVPNICGIMSSVPMYRVVKEQPNEVPAENGQRRTKSSSVKTAKNKIR